MRTAYITPFMLYKGCTPIKSKTLEEMIKEEDYISANFVLINHWNCIDNLKFLPKFTKFWENLSHQYRNLTPTSSLNKYRVNLMKKEWIQSKDHWYTELQNLFPEVKP